jgi:hypothetical protein
MTGHHNFYMLPHSLYYLTPNLEFADPSGLRRGSTAARLLGLRVLILVGAWMPVLWVLCCQVEVSATGQYLVQRSPTECSVLLCVTYKPRARGSPGSRWAVTPGGGGELEFISGIRVVPPGRAFSYYRPDGQLFLELLWTYYLSCIKTILREERVPHRDYSLATRGWLTLSRALCKKDKLCLMWCNFTRFTDVTGSPASWLRLSHDSLLGRFRVRRSDVTPTFMTEVFHGFPQSFWGYYV